MSPQSFVNISFKSAFLLTLPIALRGMASTKRSSCGTYKGASFRVIPQMYTHTFALAQLLERGRLLHRMTSLCKLHLIWRQLISCPLQEVRI